MFEQAFKNIDDVLWKEAGLIGDPIQIVFDFRTDLEELSLTPA
jgi:hypothetical protein